MKRGFTFAVGVSVVLGFSATVNAAQSLPDASIAQFSNTSADLQLTGIQCLQNVAVRLDNGAFGTPTNQINQSKPYKKTQYSKRAESSKKRHGGGFPSQRPATGNRVFIFSLGMHQWGAYDENGRLVQTGRASGGRGYCPDIHRGCHTPVGTFHVMSKGSAGCKSTRYPVRRNGNNGGAPMPYCMFFTTNFAVHGSPDVPNYNASHGCVRVLPSAAQWLSSNFMRIGTTVIVWPH